MIVQLLHLYERRNEELQGDVCRLTEQNCKYQDLVMHVLAMENDGYLDGHPEWHEIVSDAKRALA